MFRMAGVLFLGGVAGKLAGFIRELLLAALFGTSAPVAGIRVAQTATLIPVNFFCADALSSAFIPLYKAFSKDSKVEAEALFWLLFFGLGLISLGISAVLFANIHDWIDLLAPGLDSTTALLAAEFLATMALGVPLYVLGSLFSYLEMANGSSLLAAIRPTIQSLGMILGVLAAYWTKVISFLALGFVVSYGVYAVIGVFVLSRNGYLRMPTAKVLRWINPVWRKFWMRIRPLLFLPFVMQGNIAIERAVASLIGINAVAALDYAKYITEAFIVLLAVPVGVAGLSAYSSLNRKEVERSLLQVLSGVFVITIPVSLFLGLYSEPIISLLFGRGAFGESSVIVTSEILSGLAIGMWAQVAGYILIKALNAQDCNRNVMFFMVAALMANMAVNIFLYRSFGAMALGLGASMYGVVLLALGLWYFRLYGGVMVVCSWLGAGSLICVILVKLLDNTEVASLSTSAIFFIVFWMLYVFSVPALRITVLPLWDRVQRLLS